MRHRIVGRQAAFATTTRPSPRCLIAPIVRAATAPSPPTGGEYRLCAKGRTSVGSASRPVGRRARRKNQVSDKCHTFEETWRQPALVPVRAYRSDGRSETVKYQTLDSL